MKALSLLCLISVIIFASGCNAYSTALQQNVDSIIVLKSERRLQVYNNRHLLKTYKIALGEHPIGHKQYEGDRKTPEGLYFINGKNPNSTCHKNLGISYPNDTDRAAA